MTELALPDVEAHIMLAIQEATSYILNRYDKVLGIIVAGSILRGEGDLASDIDTFVIIDGDYRQRVQQYFNEIPFELFINSVDFMPLYFEQEMKDGGASTAHMLATGHTIYQQDDKILEIIQQAETLLTQAPQYDEQALIQSRYIIADRLENGFDLQQRDPLMGIALMDSAMMDMLRYQFKKDGKWIPRHKAILATIRHDYPDLARLVTRYYQADLDNRFILAGLIADYTLETRGFFEWESEKDYLD